MNILVLLLCNSSDGSVKTFVPSILDVISIFFVSLYSSVSLPQSYSSEIPPLASQISRLFPFPFFLLEAIWDGPVCLLRSHIFYLDLLYDSLL